ncbi:Conserved_hypothetical protein [Hexamita inflata]|uniref:Uncharacterized protein n=1 Tax=Hexamita inflata TaxID=28002 RepID=A0AA86N9G1_9EUKA|nr:Conserved hypothetical protein [Hexamita inflata]
MDQSLALSSRRYTRPRVLITTSSVQPVLIQQYNTYLEQNNLRPNNSVLRYLQSPSTTIDFSRDFLGSSGFIAFTTVLTRQIVNQIKEVNLRSNALDNKAVSVLVETFSGSKLEHLDLSGNCFGKGSVQMLIQLIQSCEGFKKICLKNVGGIQEENVDYIKRKCKVDVEW